MTRWAPVGASAWAALGLVVACAQGQAVDLASGDDEDAGGADARVPGRDGGRSDGSKPEPGDGSKSGCTGKVVLNELQPNGPSNAEFVELFNPGDCDVSLDGWKLLYRSDEDNAGVPLHSFGGESVPAGGFLVLGNGKFQGAKDGELSGGMGNSGGQVGLVDDDGELVDAVGYASGTAGLYTEGSPAPSAGSGSIGRETDGVDTDDNSADFKVYATPSPGNPNP